MADKEAPTPAAAAKPAASPKTAKAPPVKYPDPDPAALARAELATALTDAERTDMVSQTELDNYERAHTGYQPIADQGE